jgi:2-dehydro-3-deoxygluconokinase
VLAGAQWLHVSGTAAALGAGAIQAVRDGLGRARALGLRTSLDCNYRSALWSRERMREVLAGILPEVSLFVGSFGDAALVCGEATAAGPERKPVEAARSHGGRLAALYGIEAAAFSIREERPDGTGCFTGLVWDGREAVRSREYVSAVVDRIGSGDAFTAGLIWGMIRGEAASRVVELAAAAACLKLTIPGDFALLSPEEIERLASGEAGGIVR